MSTLITGAGGFVGGHITRHMIQRHVPVVALQRTALDVRGVPNADGPNFRRKIGDLTKRISISGPIDTIIHAAAEICKPSATEDSFDEGNVATADGVVRLAREKSCARIVALSSTSVYGRQSAPAILTERTPAAPRTPYGRSKCRAEKSLQSLSAEAQVTVLRAPGIIGCDANPNLIVNLCDQAIRHAEIRITNPDAPFNTTVHVDDICLLIDRLMAMPITPGFNIFNISSSAPKTILEIAEMIVDGLGSRSRIVVDEGGMRPQLVDATRLRGETGFEARGVEEAVKRYVSECIAATRPRCDGEKGTSCQA